MPTRPQTARVGEPLGFAEFRRAVSEAVVALDVHAEAQDEFRGAIEASTAGDIHLLRVDADRHAVHRTPGLIARAPQHYFKFSLIEHGTAILVQDGRETALATGDMAVYDTDRPYSLLFDGPGRMSLVMFPKSLLDMPAATVAPLTATRLQGSSPAAAVVRHFLSSLAGAAADLGPTQSRRLMRNAVDMVGTLLESNVGSASTAHDRLLRDIVDYIDEHLQDSELNPGQIAAAQYISVRHLHALFSEQGTTVSTLIRDRRLERCYDELVSPQHAHRSIAAIALENGFVDAAHFSRTFRAQYGVPPSAVRAE